MIDPDEQAVLDVVLGRAARGEALSGVHAELLARAYREVERDRDQAIEDRGLAQQYAVDLERQVAIAHGTMDAPTIATDAPPDAAKGQQEQP